MAWPASQGRPGAAKPSGARCSLPTAAVAGRLSPRRRMIHRPAPHPRPGRSPHPGQAGAAGRGPRKATPSVGPRLCAGSERPRAGGRPRPARPGPRAPARAVGRAPAAYPSARRRAAAGGERARGRDNSSVRWTPCAQRAGRPASSCCGGGSSPAAAPRPARGRLRAAVGGRRRALSSGPGAGGSHVPAPDVRRRGAGRQAAAPHWAPRAWRGHSGAGPRGRRTAGPGVPHAAGRRLPVPACRAAGDPRGALHSGLAARPRGLADHAAPPALRRSASALAAAQGGEGGCAAGEDSAGSPGTSLPGFWGRAPPGTGGVGGRACPAGPARLSPSRFTARHTPRTPTSGWRPEHAGPPRWPLASAPGGRLPRATAVPRLPSPQMRSAGCPGVDEVDTRKSGLRPWGVSGSRGPGSAPSGSRTGPHLQPFSGAHPAPRPAPTFAPLRPSSAWKIFSVLARSACLSRSQR